MTCLKYLTGLICLLLASPVAADVISAASCSQSDVRAAFARVTAATTQVKIPAGTCHWTVAPTLTIPAGTGTIEILGAGTTTGTARGCGTCGTVIIDDVPGTDTMWQINNNTSTARVAGFSMTRGTGGLKAQGFLKTFGRANQIRIDHNTFNGGGGAFLYSAYVSGMTGVFDHNVGTAGAGGTIAMYTGYQHGGQPFSNSADGAWSSAPGFGSSDAFFVEDNTIGSAMDCERGSRVVVRNNTVSPGNGINAHGTGLFGDARTRGCRTIEAYGNNFNDGGQGGAVVIAVTTGSALAWNNTTVSGSSFYQLVNYRRDNSQGPIAPPNGWGICGTTNGGGTNWDQNSNASTGYACLDQPGRGRGDLLSGDFPNVTNTITGGISSQASAWPRQDIEPLYEWGNTNKGGPVGTSNFFCPSCLENRDYYQDQHAAFNGSVGTGQGLLSARPATCTPRVAYWATDTKTLYQCAPANIWTIYYRPYMYPHPLATDSSASAIPTNLNVK